MYLRRSSRYAIVFGGLLLLSLTLTQTTEPYGGRARMKLLDATAPVTRVLSRAGGALAQIVPQRGQTASADEVRRLRARNAQLEDTVRQLSQRLEDLEATIRTIPPDFQIESAPILTFVRERAPVLALAPSVTDSAAVILGGRRTGLRRHLGVVWRNQVAGKVVAVGEKTSLVRFVSDPEFKMIARIARTGQLGLLVGTGRGCELIHVPADADVRQGDEVVATGDQEMFPASCYIGRVRELPRRGTLLRLPIDVDLPLARVRNVYVLRKQSALSEFGAVTGGRD